MNLKIKKSVDLFWFVLKCDGTVLSGCRRQLWTFYIGIKNKEPCVKFVPPWNDFSLSLQQAGARLKIVPEYWAEMSYKEMSRSWTIRLLQWSQKCEEGKREALTSGKNAAHTVRHIYNNVWRVQRVTVAQIWACRLSSSLLKAMLGPEFYLKWGELVMCIADPPCSLRVLRVTQVKVRRPKNGSTQVEVWRRRAPSLSTWLVCPNVNTDIIRKGFLFPMEASC